MEAYTAVGIMMVVKLDLLTTASTVILPNIPQANVPLWSRVCVIGGSVVDEMSHPVTSLSHPGVSSDSPVFVNIMSPCSLSDVARHPVTCAVYKLQTSFNQSMARHCLLPSITSVEGQGALTFGTLLLSQL
jgi:hypothetical protein